MAFLIFLAFYSSYSRESCTQAKRTVLVHFNSLKDSIDLACSSAPGQKSYLKFSDRANCGARAIYAAPNNQNVDPKVPRYIADKNISEGHYVCLSFDEDNFRCVKIACNVNMTYFGVPEKVSDMYKLGIVDGTFDFDLVVEKSNFGQVVVNATHIP